MTYKNLYPRLAHKSHRSIAYKSQKRMIRDSWISAVTIPFLVICFIINASVELKAQSLVNDVDPFIGSGGHGHVFVGASVPFGAVQVGPDNFYKGWDWCSGYNYRDSVLIGFAQTHLSGTGIGDLADILVMPYTGEIKIDKGTETNPGSGYASRYRHEDEKASPGYYSVKLLDDHIKVELTATERVAFHQYHFPKGKSGHVIIDLKEGINDQAVATYIHQIDAHTVEGYRYSKGWAKDQRIYFIIRSSLAIPKFSIYDGGNLLNTDEGKGQGIKGLMSFPQAPGTLKLKIGISPVSMENARANIKAEIPHWNFEKVVHQASAKWEKELEKIKIKSSNVSNRKIFYTALYHTMIDPALFNDHNGDYRGADQKIHTDATFDNYSVFSFWDTYRAAHPLYILTQPKRVSNMVNSILAINQQQGKLPIWHLMGNETGTMVGISSLQVVAEAYLKGIRGFDTTAAYQAAKSTAMSDGLGMKYVKQSQAIPTDKESRAVAKGMEYAVSDGSIALMAKKMKQNNDAIYFGKRAETYQKYYDPNTRFFSGYLSDGNPTADFNSQSTKNNLYAEGNAWQYLWLAPQDVKGLVSLFGGNTAFSSRLDTFFSVKMKVDAETLPDITGLIGMYAHGNEHGHHIPYLYAFVGQQWKTAEKVRQIMTDFYKDQPDGIIGNEDCGQMSAWYVFSAMGFYPVFPASGKYVLGSPLFDKASIKLENNRTFTIEAIHNQPDNIYIQKIEFNGKSYPKDYILHSDILKGGVMKFYMGSKPNYNFGKLTVNHP